MRNNIQDLFDEQLKTWDLARNNYNALKQLKIKEFFVDGCEFKVQFNPARITSSSAKVDEVSIKLRPCFLCEKNLPKEQIKMSIMEKYWVMVNPYPIFPRHFTVSDKLHTPQSVINKMADMLDIAEFMNDSVILYNGPACGASAPDHAHFQAVCKYNLPLQMNIDKISKKKINENISSINYVFPAFLVESDNKIQAISYFEKIVQIIPTMTSEIEPKINVVAWFDSNKNRTSFRIVIIPRTKHRPDCFYMKEENNILVSPATVDLCGVFITPVEKDFDKLSADYLKKILNEVCYNQVKYQQIIVNLKKISSKFQLLIP